MAQGKKREAKQLGLSAEEIRAVIESLTRIQHGDQHHRLEVGFEEPLLLEVQEKINQIVDSLNSRARESLNYSMDLSMAISECFQVLKEVRQGNLNARLPQLLLSSEEELISTLGNTLNDTIAEIQKQMDTIKDQQHVIQELSTPILEIWDDVLALPIIGVVDSTRSWEIMERLLNEIVQKKARFVILDITGVEVVDTSTADHFIKVIRAAALLGATCILTGIRPAVAHTLVELGVDLSSITTLHNLRAGLTHCLRELRGRK